MRWVVAGTELVASAILSLLADRIFKNNDVAAVVRVVLPFVGISIAISTLLLDMRIEVAVKGQLADAEVSLVGRVTDTMQAELDKHGDTMRADLAAMEGLLPAFNFYFGSTGADPLSFRTRIMDEAISRLKRLSEGEIELEDTLYYEWLTERLRARPRSVKAVNVRPLQVFESDPREESFLRENHAAIQAGAAVSRIYIVKRQELFEASSRRILLDAYQSKVTCFVAWQEEINATLLNTFRGGGLSIYDDEEVFFDRSFFRYSYLEPGSDESLKYSRLEAVVYRKPHPKFNELFRARELLYNQYVPDALKVHRTSSTAAYVDVLQDLLRKSTNLLSPSVKTEIETEIERIQQC